jgi:4-hydroxybenzoate polyprenyltransferase
MKKIVIFCVGLLATLYILNPTAGVFEIIPDNLPLVGNLDEAAAVALLLMCLKYFGIDLPNIFGRDKDDEKTIDLNSGDR